LDLRRLGTSRSVGLQKVPAEMDDPEGCVAGFLQKGSDLHRRPRASGQTDCRNDADPLRLQHPEGRGRSWVSRGVNVGEIQEDRQGTHYFEMRDLEGSVIEVSEEP